MVKIIKLFIVNKIIIRSIFYETFLARSFAKKVDENFQSLF